MKVIIDTNVLVSAAIADRNPEAIILFVISNPNFEWIVSQEILREYKEVISRPRLKLNQEQKQRWNNLIDVATSLIDVRVEIDFPRDRKDAKFLECTIAAEADFLITGDADFSEAQSFIDTPIVSVALFKKLVCDIKG